MKILYHFLKCVSRFNSLVEKGYVMRAKLITTQSFVILLKIAELLCSPNRLNLHKRRQSYFNYWDSLGPSSTCFLLLVSIFKYLIKAFNEKIKFPGSQTFIYVAKVANSPSQCASSRLCRCKTIWNKVECFWLMKFDFPSQKYVGFTIKFFEY